MCNKSWFYNKWCKCNMLRSDFCPPKVGVTCKGSVKHVESESSLHFLPYI